MFDLLVHVSSLPAPLLHWPWVLQWSSWFRLLLLGSVGSNVWTNLCNHHHGLQGVMLRQVHLQSTETVPGRFLVLYWVLLKDLPYDYSPTSCLCAEPQTCFVVFLGAKCADVGFSEAEFEPLGVVWEQIVNPFEEKAWLSRCQAFAPCILPDILPVCFDLLLSREWECRDQFEDLCCAWLISFSHPLLPSLGCVSDDHVIEPSDCCLCWSGIFLCTFIKQYLERAHGKSTVIHFLFCQLWFKAKYNTIAHVSHLAESRHCWYCIVSCAWSSHQISELKYVLFAQITLSLLIFLWWELNPFVGTSWSGTLYWPVPRVHGPHDLI